MLHRQMFSAQIELNMNFICFDTEDDSRELMIAGESGFDKRVTQIAAITGYGREFYNKGNAKDFLRWICKQPETTIYAHNLQYDLGNLFGDELDSLDCVLVGGRLIRARWNKKTFVDSFNIWPMSAAKLGSAFGLEKKEFDSESRDYVFRDVEIIRAAMLFAWEFCEQNGIPNCPATLGSLCVKLWKQWGGENSHDSTKLCREGYYGGRVELFKKRNETNRIAYTDINSLYPAMMLEKFPVTLEAQPTAKEFPAYGMARVKIKIPKMPICPLPFRDETGRIFYGFGEITGVWTLAEISAALKRGCEIQKVFEVIGTNDFEIPYSDFVKKTYAKRLSAANPAEKMFFKLLMNNLYGRIGTGGKISRTIHQTEKNQDAGVCYGSRVLVEYNMPLEEHVNWCHAAYVTSYGRIRLMEFMEKIGAENLIYCDTDSTIFDCAGEIPFPISDKLGEMKLESWETDCETYSPKMYRTGEKFKAKGVPVRLAKTFIQTGAAQFDLPFRMRESINFFDRENARKLSVWRKVSKEIRGKYDRKKLSKNRYSPCDISGIG